MTYYWSAMLRIALSVTVFELLDVEEYCDHEMLGVAQGHWNGIIRNLWYGLLFIFCSNYGRIFSRMAA